MNKAGERKADEDLLLMIDNRENAPYLKGSMNSYK